MAIGDISIPGSPNFTGGAGGSSTTGAISTGINFGNTQVHANDKSTMIILVVAAIAFYWVTKHA